MSECFLCHITSIDDWHTGFDGEDVCPNCCPLCTSDDKIYQLYVKLFDLREWDGRRWVRVYRNSKPGLEPSSALISWYLTNLAFHKMDLEPSYVEDIGT